MLTAKVQLFSDSSPVVQVHWMQAVLLTLGKKEADDVAQRNSCKNRNDTPGQPVHIE